MRLPLLLEAEPREVIIGPLVRLHKGTWKFTVSSHIDHTTILIRRFEDGLLTEILPYKEAIYSGPVIVQAVIDPSDEKRLSIYAELVHDAIINAVGG